MAAGVAAGGSGGYRESDGWKGLTNDVRGCREAEGGIMDDHMGEREHI